MQITCRRDDAHLFTELGFRLTTDDGCPIVEMVDEQAKYAHAGSLPENVPWIGESGSADSFSPANYTCDGKVSLEVLLNDFGEYSVSWSDKHNGPDPDVVKQIRQFIRVKNKVQRLFKRMAKSFANQSRRMAIAAAKNPFHS